MKKVVYAGLSGGVDSSAAAALLKEKGHQVVGVYMKNWTQDLPGFPCPWMEDYQDAKRVAVKLGIEFKVYDFEKEYKQKVVEYMIEEYQAGRTPNPDIMCNQEVKFKLFLDAALEDGADMIATGHYARTKDGKLLTAANPDKDQTYFLYRVSEDALKKSLMPIGNYKTKDEVRSIAKKYDLSTASKKDSQGICFVGKIGIKDFLSNYIAAEAGSIIDSNGKIIGQHDGAVFYTIGQRHGLNVGGGLPFYVSGKNMDKNEIYATTDLDDENLWTTEFTITNTHWINNRPDENFQCMARTRYRAPLVDCKLQSIERTTAKVILSQPIRAITPGQSAVFYVDDLVLGGGIVADK